MDFSKIVQNWDKYMYPWRPGASFLSYIKNELEGCSNLKTLLLGSTPEIRELCRGQDITVCDISPEMIYGLAVGNDEEKNLIQDWFSLGDREEQYDLVIGDLIFLMFDEDQTGELIQIIKSILTPGGKMFVRDVLLNGSHRSSDYDFTTISGCNIASFDLICGLGLSRESIAEQYNVSRLYLGEYFHIIPYKDGDANVKSVDFFEKQEVFCSVLKYFSFCRDVLLEYSSGKQ